MMNYESFKVQVSEKFMEYMPEQYRDMSLKLQKVNKTNCILDGIFLVSNTPGRKVAPTIYINDMYAHYRKCNDLQEVMKVAAEFMEMAMLECNNTNIKLDFSNVEDNIIFQFINTEQNRELLKEIPHREFLDLSIIYRYIAKVDEKGIHSCIVKSSFAEKFHFKEEQLFELAMKNTRRILPPAVKNMHDVFYETYIQDGMPKEIAEMLSNVIPEDYPMYVISNDRYISGAISMLYEDKLHEIAIQLNSDLYIMPVSVNEVIVVATYMGEPDKFAEMVAEINMQEIKLSERLSNQVYYYNKDLRRITLATNTPNKRLDVI